MRTLVDAASLLIPARVGRFPTRAVEGLYVKLGGGFIEEELLTQYCEPFGVSHFSIFGSRKNLRETRSQSSLSLPPFLQ